MDMAWNAQRTDREVQFVGQYDALPCVVRLAITTSGHTVQQRFSNSVFL